MGSPDALPRAAVTYAPSGLRRRCYQIFEIGAEDWLARVFNVALVVIIALNTLAVVLESVAALQAQFVQTFIVIEIVSVAVFSVEYLCRVWACVEGGATGDHSFKTRLRYMLKPLALIDLLAVLPFYLSFLVGTDLRFLRVLRLMRLLKLTRHFSSLNIMADVIKAEARAFGAALFVMAILIIAGAGIMYFVEHDAQPDAFGSIPAAMWWALVTLTTVGYGDVIPLTVGGKVVGAGIMILSIGMVALPAGMLASRFSEELRTRRHQYERRVDVLLADGVIDAGEKQELTSLQSELCLSDEDVDRILATVQQQEPLGPQHCPHCGGSIDADID